MELEQCPKICTYSSTTESNGQIMKSNRDGFLTNLDGHDVAWYEYGNPMGKPVLFLHGGPGAGFSTDYLKFFPLNDVRFITLDQRGSGRSKPFGLLKNNTTQDLINDIERLRYFLGIDSWAVAGHSWGATLAVLYAKSHPQVCRKLLLSSFFGALPEDHAWSFDGVRLFFPEQVEALHSLHMDKRIPFKLWVSRALHEANNLEVAYRLSALTSVTCRMTPKIVNRADITEQRIIRWQILMHYAEHDFFLKNKSLYENLSVLSMPIYVVHGQYDLDCPPEQVLRLRMNIPHIDITLVPGGHNVMEEPLHNAFHLLMQKMCD